MKLFSITKEINNRRIHLVIKIFGLKIKIKKLRSFMGRVKGDTIIIKYYKENDSIKIINSAGVESRHASTIYLFTQAFNRVRSQINNDVKFKIKTIDFVISSKHKIFAYSTVRGAKNVIPIPDYSFLNWIEAHINDHDQICKEIAAAGDILPEYDKLFWIGNIKTNPIREVACTKFKDNPNFEFVAMNWHSNVAGQKNNFDKFVSLADHTKYKYLLDMAGWGWSGRLKYLLFTKRPLFYVERDKIGYFEPDLKPFVHYIPVKADLSDLNEKYEWAENNPEKSKEIAINAYNYAAQNLTRDAAIETFSKIILDFAN